jgi:IS5 family transposase
VGWAVEEKLADPKVLVADLTAQVAQIPHPNEMGLLSSFLKSVAGASSKAGGALKQFVSQAGKSFTEAKKKLREYRLFAKDKSKKQKDKMTKQMVALVEQVQGQLGKALAVAAASKDRLKKYGKVAHAKVEQLHQTMKQLTPQIRYWLKTGWVAAGKVINMHIPELYSVVRGKVGKKVEFGLSWGIRHLRGGYLLATLANGRNDLPDSKFCVSAIDEHIALFGKPPQSYAYDRGGWSNDNVAAIEKRGVKDVGLAPRGKTKWKVSGKIKEKLVNERAQVEGGIGTIKHQKYGFNRPAARSARMMGTCGQLAVLGFNVNKIVRELAARRKVVLVG